MQIKKNQATAALRTIYLDARSNLGALLSAAYDFTGIKATLGFGDGSTASSTADVAMIGTGIAAVVLTQAEANTALGPLAAAVASDTDRSAMFGSATVVTYTVEELGVLIASIVTLIGTPVADISTDVATISTLIGTPADTDVSTDIANVATTIGTPADTDVSTDIANVAATQASGVTVNDSTPVEVNVKKVNDVSIIGNGSTTPFHV
jgi:hypothetical protein